MTLSKYVGLIQSVEDLNKTKNSLFQARPWNLNYISSPLVSSLTMVHLADF